MTFFRSDAQIADEVLATKMTSCMTTLQGRVADAAWLAHAVKRLIAELAEVREGLRVEELESAHWLSLACDDPGKNPPLLYKDLYKTERAARVAAEGRMRTPGTVEVCRRCRVEMDPPDTDALVATCKGEPHKPCPIRSARGA